MSTYYISPAGDNGNPGTLEEPFLTIQKGIDVSVPGDIVIVRDGTYATAGTHLVDMTEGGMPDGIITIKAENIGGAVLDGNNNAAETAFYLYPGIRYTRIEGFEIKGFSKSGIYLGDINQASPAVAVYPCQYIEIRDCHIHHIGRYCTDTATSSPAGIVCFHTKNSIIERCKIGYIGRFEPGESACVCTTENYKNQDHALYLNGVSELSVRYNIFYSNKRGQSIHLYSYNDTPFDHVFIYNNVFYDGNPYAGYLAGFIQIWGNLAFSDIANNVFHTMEDYAINIQTGYVYSLSLRNNITYGGRNVLNTGTLIGITLSDNLDGVDPLFTDPSLLDFTLQDGSPAINAGIPVGLNADYFGNDIEGVPDCGIHEVSDPPVVKDAEIDPNLTGYLPVVAWTTIVEDVVKLSDWRYRVTIHPTDLNEPGAGQKQVGYYLIDWIGHTYHFKAINVGGKSSDVELSDELRCGAGPQIGQEAKVYRSVGNGEAPIVGAVEYNELDKRALDYKYGIDMDILWKARGDIDQLTGLASRNVSVVFKKIYLTPPIGIGNLKVYRITEEMPGKPVPQMVLYHSPVVTTTGFTFIIDESEPLEGVIVEYSFTQAT